MSPGLANSYVTDRNITDAKTLSYPCYRETGFKQLSYREHISFRKLMATVVTSSIDLQSEYSMAMEEILSPAYIFEIAGAIVGLDSIFMIGFFLIWFGTKESIRNESVHGKSAVNAIKRQGNKRISIRVEGLHFYDWNSRTTETSYFPKIADFISAYISGDWFPDFFGHDCMLA